MNRLMVFLYILLLSLMLDACSGKSGFVFSGTCGDPDGGAERVVGISITPGQTSVPVNRSMLFVASLAYHPASQVELAEVDWMVDNVPGGNDRVGRIDGIGNYTAPARVPSPATVLVQARSRHCPDLVAQATVPILGACSGLTITPQPEAVALGTRKRFTVTNQNILGVTWIVNSTEHGTRQAGWIRAKGPREGEYRPPALTDVRTGPEWVIVEARSTQDAQLCGSVSFPLVDVYANPSQVTGNEPGQRLPFSVLTRYSNGREDSIGNLATTDYQVLNTRIATKNTGMEMVLAQGVGETEVLLTDKRFTPPPKGLLKVLNLPKMSLQVEPPIIEEVIKGQKREVRFYLEADRGAVKDTRNDVTATAGLAGSARDANGLVSADGTPPAADPATYVACLDLKNGQVVLGGKEGTALFRIQEGKSGAAAELTVTLKPVKVVLEVRNSWSDAGYTYADLALAPPDLCHHYNTVRTCPPGTLPHVIITHESAVTPADFTPVNIFFELEGDDQARRTFFEQLRQVTVTAEAQGGRFQRAGYIIGPHSQYASIHPVDPARDRGWRRDRIEMPPAICDNELANCQDYFPNNFIYADFNYAAGTHGLHDLKVTIKGLSLLPGDTVQSHLVPVKGILPIAQLGGNYYMACEQNSAICTLRGTGPHIMYPIGHRNRTQGSPPHLSEGLNMVIKGSTPSGASFSELQWSAVGSPGENQGAFDHYPAQLYQLFLAEKGQYSLWLETRQYPGIPLTTPFTVEVQPHLSYPYGYGLQTPPPQPVEDMLEISSDSNLYDIHDGAMILKVRLRDRHGALLKALPFGNELCSGRSGKEKEVATYFWVRAQMTGADYTSSGASKTFTASCYDDPAKGQVQVRLLTDQAQAAPLGWRPPANGSDLSIAVSLLQPLANTCKLTLTMGYKWMDDHCQQIDWNNVPHYNVSKTMEIWPRWNALAPRTLYYPVANPGGLAFHQARVRFSGESVARAVSSGNLPGIGHITLLDENLQPLPGVTVTEVASAEENTLEVRMRLDAQDMENLGGEHFLQVDSPYLKVGHPLTITVLRLRGEGPIDIIEPIPLNARPGGGEPEGTTSFRLEVVKGGSYSNIPLKVTSPEDRQDFRLVGFSRQEAEPTGKGGRITLVGREDINVFTEKGASGAGPYGWGKVRLYGNLTDLTTISGNTLLEMPDFVPDVVSGQPNGVEIKTYTPLGDEVLLGRTTAYVFEARRSGDIRTGDLAFNNVRNWRDIADRYNFKELKGGLPSQVCSPLATTREDDPNRDLYLHVDNSVNVDGSGVLDQKVMEITGGARPDDGRVHAYGGESTFGKPGLLPASDSGFTYFGAELDGICFDPGFGNDVAPNSPALFSFANDGNYSVTPGNHGLVHGVGGASGGRIAPDGRFSLVARTPGVDFPGLDCGFLAEHTPATLGVNDIEGALIDSTLCCGTMSDPDPFRVVGFGSELEGKEWLMTGLQTRGARTAFEFTTRPAKPDGSPLVRATLKAGVLAGEWAHVIDPNQGMLLTARVDGDTLVHIKAAQWGIPALTALLTAAVGTWLEGGSLLLDIGVNVLISLGMTALDKWLDISLGTEGGGMGGAVASKAAGKMTSKVASRLRKILKFSVMAARGALQTISRRRTHHALFKSAKVASTTAFTQDALGGIFAGYISEMVVDSLLNETTVGQSQAYAFDQLWLSLPKDSLVQATDGRPRAFTVADLKFAHLSAQYDPSKNSRIEIVGDQGESDAHLRMWSESTGPLLLIVYPKDQWKASPGGSQALCPQAETDTRTADFRIRVGGTDPTAIRYSRSSLVGVTRNTEEGTARVKTSRFKTPISLRLLDAVME